LNLFVLLLSSQLLYYLLIAQTGVVGVFHSHIHDLYTLPIGGIIGSILSALWQHNSIKWELYFLFGVQMIISWFYPHYSLGMLLALGFVVGYTTPLLLYIFSSQGKLQLSFGLAIAYTVGTAFYTYPFDQRWFIAVLLPIISLITLHYSHVSFEGSSEKKMFHWSVLGVMMLWIFADSALFETLARSVDMNIWSEYTLLIITFHLAGVFLAYRYGRDLVSQTHLIWIFFAVSYILYWIKEPIILAIVYPIVISYYNVLLFQALIRLADIRLIALSMVGVGWIATSIANAIALEHQLWIAAIVLGLFALLYPFYFRRIS
jgi:beta-carotene 15,15'-dioxygenase